MERFDYLIVGGRQFRPVFIRHLKDIQTTGKNVSGIQIIEGFIFRDHADHPVHDAPVFYPPDFHGRAGHRFIEYFAQIADDVVAGIFDLKPCGAFFFFQFLQFCLDLT